MEFKKVVGLMVVLLAVCSAPDVSLSQEDITTYNNLKSFLEKESNDTGTVSQDIEMSGPITTHVHNYILTSNTGNTRSLTGADSITIAAGAQLTLYGLNVEGGLALAGDNSKLILGQKSDNRDFTIGIISGSGDVTVDTGAVITAGASIGAKSLTLTSGELKGESTAVTLSDKAVISAGTFDVRSLSAKSYDQDGGTVKLSNDLTVTDGIDIDGGTLTLGATSKAAANNFDMAQGTSLVSDGVNSVTTTNGINISGTAESKATVNVNENHSLTLTPGTTLSLSNVNSTVANGGTLTFDTSKGSATVNDTSITLSGSGALNLKGNTTVQNSQVTLSGEDSKLNIDSTSGDVTFVNGSNITNSGTIEVAGDSNNVNLNGTINSDGNTQGSIHKTGSNTLNLNGKVNTSSLQIENGITNVNEDVTVSGDVQIKGSKGKNQNATVNVAQGKSITAQGAVSLGSQEDYEYTHVNLNQDSKLSGSSVTINSEVDMTKATIEATAAEGSVTIGRKSNITVKALEGQDITISTIKGAIINILGGSVITVENGARLVYDGQTVNSTDAHYDIKNGAVWQASNGVYTNADFTGNGAILNNEGNVSFLGGSQETPMSFTESFASGNGGAVYNAQSGTIDVYDNVSFSKNKSSGTGGALYNEGNFTAHNYTERGTLATNTIFDNNKAGFDNNGNVLSGEHHGGAIYNAPTGKVHLGDNSVFTSNVATGNGGGIYNGNADNQAVVVGNGAIFRENISYGNGGAVYNNAGTVTIGENANFSTNSAGIGINGRANPVKNSDGGAIYNAGNSTVVVGKNAVFNDNFATQSGGAIYNEGKLTFDGSSTRGTDFSVQFTRNQVSGSTSAQKKGGAVYNKGTIETKSENGGTVNGFYKALFGSAQSTEYGNSAQQGGAIYNEVGPDNTLVIEQSTFVNNSATTAGGAIYNASGTLDIHNGSVFQKNLSMEGEGGAIYNAAGANLNLVEGLVFGGVDNGNQANKGGAIYNAGQLNSNGTEQNTVKFIANSAISAGGALYNETSGLNLQYVDFEGNVAGSLYSNNFGQGGAIYNTGSNVNIRNANFRGNIAQGQNGSDHAAGGAIYNEGDITFDNEVVISENSATDASGSNLAKGGAIYNSKNIKFNTEVELQSNVANGQGGAIFNAKEATLSFAGEGNTLIGGRLEEIWSGVNPTRGNNADKGGGIYNEGSLKLSKSEAENPGGNFYIVGNKATTAGGGIYNVSNVAGGVINPETQGLYNTYYYNNSVVPALGSQIGYGGGLYNEKNTLDVNDSNLITISNSYFENNSADIGSAIYNTGKMAIDSSVLFQGNKVGSAIGNEGILTLPLAFLIDNQNPNAGAIWNQGNGIVNTYGLYLSNFSTPNTQMIYPSMLISAGYVDDSLGRAAVSGAALHLTDESQLNLSITGLPQEYQQDYPNSIKAALFSNNIGYKGGALYKDSKDNLTIGSPINGLPGNINMKLGLDETSPVYPYNVLFSNNIAYQRTDLPEDNTADGGAIYNSGKDGRNSSINIKNDVIFLSNIATGKGGAIYNGVDGQINFDPGFTLGESSQGYSNIAQVGGGGIASYGLLQFSNGNDRAAYFTYQGGGADISDINLHIFNGDGGAIYLGGSAVVNTDDLQNTMNNFVFTHNESLRGGAIFNDSYNPLTIQSSQFSSNRGYRDGGAIYTGSGSDTNIILDNLNIFTGNYSGNTMPSISSSGKGGAIYNSGILNISVPEGTDAPIPTFVGNSAIGEDGRGGAIYNQGNLTVHGNTEFYRNSAEYGGAILNDGVLTLDISNGDIVFNQNYATAGSAIYMQGDETSGSSLTIDGNNLHSVTFSEADPLTGTPAQTIASDPSTASAIAVRGGRVNFLSDASGYHGSYYQTGGIVTTANKFLDVSDAPIKAVTDGTFIFENGAQLVSDDLTISNNELTSKATVIFNKNDKSKLSDLSALYDSASTNNYFLYGSDENGYHKVILRAADVEINDDALIAQDATIGNARNSYSVRNLKLSNGATIGKNITVVGGSQLSEEGATLTLAEGVLGSEQAGVYLKDYNANLKFENSRTPLVMGGSLKNDGPTYNSSISKSGDGLVLVTGDASAFNGNYSQSAGIVEFASGSKFFGDGTSFVKSDGSPSITGGKLQIDDGTIFTGHSYLKLGSGGGFSTSVKSNVDLTGDNVLLSIGEPNLTVEFDPNSLLEVTNNSSVNAQKDQIFIGNENLQVNSVVLGGSTNVGSVDVTVNPNTTFVLQNDRAAADPAQVGLGGVLGLGSNVKFHDAAGNSVVPNILLKDNTQLRFTNDDDAKQTLNIVSDNAQGWADSNGDIVKENKGKVVIDGNYDNFHGSLILKNGEIATNGKLFNSDVKFDLSQLSDGAVASVNNIINSNDLFIVGNVGEPNSSKVFNLSVNNNRGNIEFRQDANSPYNNVYLYNNSVANFSSAGSVNMNDLTIKDSTVNLLAGNMNVFGNMSMGSNYNMINNQINTLNIANNLTLTGNSNFAIDINPIFYQSDKVIINGNVQSDSSTPRALNISDWKLMSDPVSQASVYQVFDVKGSVNNVVFTTTKNTLFTPIANYMFNSLGNGSYMLYRTGYTPAAMAVPVAMQVGGYLNQLASYDMAFGNLDTVLNLPLLGYYNRYANSDDEQMVYSPIFIPELDKGLWFRPYGNFEKVSLHDGPKVNNQSYGAFVGGDTPLTELGKGFQGTLSAYAGYTGSHQSFDGISNYQNGGTLGVTGAVYKGGFFSGLTVNVNASGNDSSTPYGNNDFFMLGLGVASKTGYNWELARGKFVIQPSWLMSYSYINAFDPGKLAGIYNIDADGLHGIQISPQIKFIANLPYGWQPYALFNFRWNLADETHVTINSIDIPEISVKPYLEYGIGVQKRWGDRFTGYGQFLGRGVGRTGVGLNFGFRWSIGSGR